MDDGEQNLFRLRREVVAEHFAEETVHDGVQAFVDESIPVLLGVPDIDVAESAFWELGSEMHDQPLRWGVAEVYVMLSAERGWSPDRYERWLADSWGRLLLPDG